MGCDVVILGFPLKKASSGDDLVNPILSAIQTAFPNLSGEDVSAAKNALTEIQQLRVNCCNKFAKVEDKEELLSQLTRYYDSLCVLEKKFDPSSLEIGFKWDDAFDEGSYFRRTRATVGRNIGFEKLCVLFNIAAVHSQIASSLPCGDDDQLQAAAKALQQANSLLVSVKLGMPEACQEATPDLTSESLTALASLMSAQRLETILLKAIKDDRKPEPIAKVCMEVSSAYKEATKLLSVDGVKYLFPRANLVSAGKEDAYRAVGEFFQAKIRHDEKKYGETVSRLRKASELMKSAAYKAGYEFPQNLKDFSEKIEAMLASSSKENDIIYLDAVPSFDRLELIKESNLAKIVPFTGRFSPEEPTPFDFLHDFEGTEEALRIAQESMPEEEASLKRVEASDIKREANEAFLNEKYDEAIGLFDSALKICPARFKEDRAILFQNRAAARLHQGKVGAALMDLNRALDLNSMYLKARLKRAQVLEEMHMKAQAVEDYEKILEMDPEHGESVKAVERLKA